MISFSTGFVNFLGNLISLLCITVHKKCAGCRQWFFQNQTGRPAHFYSRGQRAKYPCKHGYLATAARVKDPRTLVRCALQRCKFDTSLLAARSLIFRCRLMWHRLMHRRLFPHINNWYPYHRIPYKRPAVFSGWQDPFRPQAFRPVPRPGCRVRRSC